MPAHVTSRMKFWGAISALCFSLAVLLPQPAQAETRFIQVAAKDKIERTAIANTGMSIEAVRSDSVWGFANESAIRELKALGFKILGDFSPEIARGERQGAFDFPVADAKYHTFAEAVAELKGLAAKNVDIARLRSIGKSTEGRDLWALHINTSSEALSSGTSAKPGAVFMGAHHAREHLTVEVPLMLARHLLENRADPRIATLLDTRDIWIIPMVNPDGAEYDVSTGRYKYWRKNRRDNRDGNFGVDLNRNYDFKWGQGGSSRESDSDTYMGPAPFSEPETQSVRDFLRARVNARMLLSFHTYGELILYPWGGSYETIGNAKDLAVYQKMAQAMASWNNYTAQQSSELYIATGDTTDWAYAELGIFSFTFELSPDGGNWGGFYPGAAMIDKAFNDNLRPCLYMIEAAGDPYRVVDQQPSGWLKNYVEPKVPQHLFWEPKPLPLASAIY